MVRFRLLPFALGERAEGVVVSENKETQHMATEKQWKETSNPYAYVRVARQGEGSVVEVGIDDMEQDAVLSFGPMAEDLALTLSTIVRNHSIGFKQIGDGSPEPFIDWSK